MNFEYENSYEAFGTRRQVQLERFDQEDALQAELDKLNERECRQARAALDEKRSAKHYEHDYGYYDDVNYDDDFEEDPTAIPLEFCDPNDWRTHHRANANITLQRQLELFRRQVYALEQRVPTTSADSKKQIKRLEELREIEQDIVDEIAEEEVMKQNQKTRRHLEQNPAESSSAEEGDNCGSGA